MNGSIRFRSCLLPGLLLAALAGCNGPAGSNEETSAAGRKATVELRPVLTSDTSAIHKQRSGILVKLTSDWVVIKENETEIWIPRDIVLEVRIEG